MVNYYQILGIDPSADAGRIRAAYKRLAMQYHPDHNPDNKQAEEVFKIVNEAYHTLSDSLKKARYDNLLFPPVIAEPEIIYNRRQNQRYNRPTQDRPPQSYYRIDKTYFKHQALALLTFIIIGGCCFALLNIWQYLVNTKRTKHQQANQLALKQASGLFADGRFDDAFHTIHSLTETDPLELRISSTRDSLMRELRLQANKRFDNKDYAGAIALYVIIQKQEEPSTLETLQKVAMAQYYLGNYKESLAAMKQLDNENSNSIELMYSMGMLSLEKLEDPGEALRYFNRGKDLLNTRLSRLYGPAFKETLVPASLPEIYADVFQGSARSNMLLRKFDDTVADCDWGIRLRPNAGGFYKLRAAANGERHVLKTVCADLLAAKRLGATDIASLEEKYCR